MNYRSRPIVIQQVEEKQKLHSALETCDKNVTKLVISDLRELEQGDINLDEYEELFDEVKEIRSKVKEMIALEEMLPGK